MYDRRTLLDIGQRYTNLIQNTLSADPAWPLEILRNNVLNNDHLNNRRRRRKHRRRRAGIRNRLRKRAHSPPLPSILLANVQSLENKIKVQGSLLFVTYTIIQGIIGSEMLESSLHLTHPKCIRTWSSGQPLYGARGAVRGSVPCSGVLQSQVLPARDSNLRTSGYRPDSLTIRPRLPLRWTILEPG